jgi:hypothetical protein
MPPADAWDRGLRATNRFATVSSPAGLLPNRNFVCRGRANSRRGGAGEDAEAMKVVASINVM